MGTPMDQGTALCVGWLLVLFFVGSGLIVVFAKDLAWELTQWRNQAAGVQSERSTAWEITTTAVGIAQISFGIAIVLMLIG